MFFRVIWHFYQAAETLTDPSLLPAFCKDPCLRMHFNCIKVTRGLLIGPSLSHPPTRLLGWLSASRIVIWQHSLLWKPQPAREPGGCDRSREGLREPGIFQEYECLWIQNPSRGLLEVRGGHYLEVGLWTGGFSPPFRTPHHMQKSIRVHGAW